MFTYTFASVDSKGDAEEQEIEARLGKSGVKSFEWSPITLVRVSWKTYYVNRYLLSIRMERKGRENILCVPEFPARTIRNAEQPTDLLESRGGQGSNMRPRRR